MNMNDLHRRLPRDVLEVGNDLPFVLTGGYAVQAHGIVDRLSRDIDAATLASVDSGSGDVELPRGPGEWIADMLLVSQRGRAALGDFGARLDAGPGGNVQVACPAGYVDLHCPTW
jgi:hypothetical protein